MLRTAANHYPALNNEVAFDLEDGGEVAFDGGDAFLWSGLGGLFLRGGGQQQECGEQHRARHEILP